MLAFAILKTLGQSKIDYENVVFGAFGAAYEKVVWFDVSMDYAFFVTFLDALN